MKRQIKEFGSYIKGVIEENSPISYLIIVAIAIFLSYTIVDVQIHKKRGSELAYDISIEERAELTEKLADVKWLHRIGLIDDEELAILSEKISKCRYSKEVFKTIDQTFEGLDIPWRDNSDSLSHLIDR